MFDFKQFMRQNFTILANRGWFYDRAVSSYLAPVFSLVPFIAFLTTKQLRMGQIQTLLCPIAILVFLYKFDKVIRYVPDFQEIPIAAMFQLILYILQKMNKPDVDKHRVLIWVFWAMALFAPVFIVRPIDYENTCFFGVMQYALAGFFAIDRCTHILVLCEFYSQCRQDAAKVKDI